MSRRVIVKVYGHVWPVSDDFQAAMEKACAGAIADCPGANCSGEDGVVQREGELLRISFEGLYFPLEEALDALARHLKQEHRGRLDVLDIENWRLTRHSIAEGGIHAREAPLNAVLDHSGS